MTFQPFAIGTGLSAWRGLQRALPNQKALFDQTPTQKRLTDHFRTNAVGITSSADLIRDRRLREVALTAFGLGDDINSQAFIRRILDEGTSETSALANRLADARYKQLSEAFAFDGTTRLVGLTTNQTDQVLNRFRDQSFELALGETQPDLRLALNAQRELPRIASEDVSKNAKWYLVMGNPPLRQVFETALGLPKSFGGLDLERQLDVFREKSLARFGAGEIEDLSKDDALNKLIDQFLLKQQVKSNSTASSANIALMLLRT